MQHSSGIKKQTKTLSPNPFKSHFKSPRDHSPRGWSPKSPGYSPSKSPTPKILNERQIEQDWERFEKNLHTLEGFYMQSKPWGIQLKKMIRDGDIYKKKAIIAEIVKGHLKYTYLHRMSYNEKKNGNLYGQFTMKYKEICKTAVMKLLDDGKLYKKPIEHKKEICNIIMGVYSQGDIHNGE